MSSLATHPALSMPRRTVVTTDGPASSWLPQAPVETDGLPQRRAAEPLHLSDMIIDLTDEALSGTGPVEPGATHEAGVEPLTDKRLAAELAERDAETADRLAAAIRLRRTRSEV